MHCDFVVIVELSCSVVLHTNVVFYTDWFLHMHLLSFILIVYRLSDSVKYSVSSISLIQ